MKPHFSLIAIVILAIALTVATPQVASANVEQDQERIALDYVKAHNAANVDTMGAFRAKHFQRSTVADWQAGYQRLVAQLGHLNVRGIMIDGPGQMELGVKAENSEDDLRLRFEFHEDDPNQIRTIELRAEGSDGPSDDNLPPLTLEGGWRRRVPAIDRYLSDLEERGTFSGAVLIAEADGIRFEKAYGLASREFDAANNVDTRFDVGSCNKDYTHVAILQLQRRGALSVSDTVGKYLPRYPNEEVRQQVTLQQLLDHRSGLGDYFTDEYWETPMSQLREIEDYIPIWGPKPLLSPPGERESYSNYGYTVLGAIIEKVSGQSYPDYVVEHIFKPAGMSHSGFFETDAVVPNVAVGYTLMGPEGSLDRPIKNIYLEPAKGGPWGKSYSTVGDLYRFYHSMIGGKLLDDEDNWLGTSLDNLAIALGGAGPGLNTLVSIEAGTIVVVMANIDPPIAENVAFKISRALRN